MIENEIEVISLIDKLMKRKKYFTIVHTIVELFRTEFKRELIDDFKLYYDNGWVLVIEYKKNTKELPLSEYCESWLIEEDDLSPNEDIYYETLKYNTWR